MSLNKDQYHASRPTGGISLVIAGAGTGKTRTLVEKVSNIIIDGTTPERTVVLTFSRKAADEIKERVRTAIGEDAERIVSGTFHSFCLSLLREYREAFLTDEGFSAFPRVVDDELRDHLLTGIIRHSLDQFLGLPVDAVKYLLNNYEKLTSNNKKKLLRNGIADRIFELRRFYRQMKCGMNYIDFEDMIDFSIGLLEKHVTIRNDVVNRFNYILVDEFQDTSENNFRLLKLLLPPVSPNLFVVGDDWQSIYGFRDARVEYTVRMKRYFPNVTLYKLRRNYRSRKELVSLSNRFIRRNRFRTRKRIVSSRGRGGRFVGIGVHSLAEECRTIQNIVEVERDRSDTLAVLYRNNWQGHYIREQLIDYHQHFGNRIALMTIHSSKGLEFHTVIIAGVMDDILPDRSSDLEEERRLFYVALTRAKEQIFIIYHRTPDGTLPRFALELGLSDN